MTIKNKINLLLIFGVYPENSNLIKGGVQGSMWGLTNALILKEKIRDIVVVSPSSSLENDCYIKNRNLKVIHLSNKNKNYLIRMKKISKYISYFSPDIVHIRGTGIWQLMVILLLLIKKIPYVLTIHGLAHIEHKNKLHCEISLKNIFQMFVCSSSEFLCMILSKHINVHTEYVKNKIPFLSFKKVVIIPQGISRKYYELQDNPHSKNIISIGVISPRKGYEYSIEAIEKIILKHCPYIKYHICGYVSDEKYYQEIKSLIKRKKLERNIMVIPNASTDEIQEYLKRANIFILHSQEESQGIVFCEAMAVGKPIVATNIGGIPYIVKQGETGYLVEYGDVDSFAQKIIELLENPEIRNTMSLNCRREALRYDWNTLSEKVLETYMYVLQ